MVSMKGMQSFYCLEIIKYVKKRKKPTKSLRWPRIELGSTAWKATMLTITPPTPCAFYKL